MYSVQSNVQTTRVKARVRHQVNAKDWHVGRQLHPVEEAIQNLRCPRDPPLLHLASTGFLAQSKIKCSHANKMPSAPEMVHDLGHRSKAPSLWHARLAPWSQGVLSISETRMTCAARRCRCSLSKQKRCRQQGHGIASQCSSDQQQGWLRFLLSPPWEPSLKERNTSWMSSSLGF